MMTKEDRVSVQATDGQEALTAEANYQSNRLLRRPQKQPPREPESRTHLLHPHTSYVLTTHWENATMETGAPTSIKMLMGKR